MTASLWRWSSQRQTGKTTPPKCLSDWFAPPSVRALRDCENAIKRRVLERLNLEFQNVYILRQKDRGLIIGFFQGKPGPGGYGCDIAFLAFGRMTRNPFEML